MHLTPAQYAKAIIGAIMAGLTTLGTAMLDGHITGPEWVGVAVAVCATFGGVFGVQNSPTL